MHSSFGPKTQFDRTLGHRYVVKSVYKFKLITKLVAFE